ncbi:unnamed protein product, partial [Iphiclides podalirius]
MGCERREAIAVIRNTKTQRSNRAPMAAPFLRFPPPALAPSLVHRDHEVLATESTPTASSPVASTSAAPGGNFSRCTARFTGEARDAETVEAFIEAVQVYKECADVSDEHALRGFPMLLEGNAAAWWRGTRNGVLSWSEAVVRLRTMYGSPPPAYKVLREIFAAEQQGDERGEVFVAKVRAIIARLPYNVPETMQIDIIYGLLHRHIKKRLARDSIISLEHLSEKVRVTEEAIEEIKLPSR